VTEGAWASAVLKQVSRSFHLSLAVLPRSIRPAIGLAYLLARAADTIADTRLVARASRVDHLRALRGAVARASDVGSTDWTLATAANQSNPSERRLLERLPECLAGFRALPGADRQSVRDVVLTLIAGMTEDLQHFPGEDETALAALETWQDLDRYTYLVAGCVGEFWTDVAIAHLPRLQTWDATAMRPLGVRLGKALQMTNVLRDVPRDLRQGRCYLPRRALSELGLSPSDLLDPAAARRARPLLAAALQTALDHYEAGWRYTLAIPRAEARLRLACAWPLLIGLRTLDLLARDAVWLDPARVIKISRGRVYGLIAGSTAAIWSNGRLAALARHWVARVRAAAALNP